MVAKLAARMISLNKDAGRRSGDKVRDGKFAAAAAKVLSSRTRYVES